jgi:hypothetical protein
MDNEENGDNGKPLALKGRYHCRQLDLPLGLRDVFLVL